MPASLAPAPDGAESHGVSRLLGVAGDYPLPAIVIAVALTAAIFLADTGIPLGFSVWAFYFVPFLLLALAVPRYLVAYVIAFAGLAVVGLLLSPAGGIDLLDGFINRGMFAASLVLVAGLSFLLNEQRAGLSTENERRQRAERTLQESEERLRVALEAADLGTWDLDLTTDVAIRSERHDQILGYRELQPEWGLEIALRHMVPEDRPVVIEAHARARETGVLHHETRILWPDGTLHWIEANGRVHYDRDGRPVRIVGVVADVTERKRAREALEESEAKYRSLVDLSPDGIVVHRSGTILYANPVAARLFGTATPDGLLGTGLLDLVHPEDCATVNGGIGTAQDKPGSTPLQEFRLVIGGTVTDVEAVGGPVVWEGTPAVQVIIREITARKQMERDLAVFARQAELRASELDAAFASTAAGAIIYDASGAIVRMNDAARAMIGTPPASLDPGVDDRYKAAPEVTQPDGTPLSREAAPHSRALCGEVVRGEEVVFTRVHDEPLWVVTSAAPIRDGAGRIAGAIAISTDITAQKRTEEELRQYAEDLRRSNEDLERFAYVSSHDLQEPLRSIVSFSQLLEKRYRGQLGPEADEYIDFIVEGGQRMQTLIQDLLAYSRVNTTKQELGRTDTADVLAAVKRSLDVPLCEAGATLVHDPMPVVVADPLQLEQVFANLVSNAIKFRRPDVPLRIRIGARRTDGCWEFSVSDNGIGIAPEYFERIFVIFQRLHTKEKYPGTGIGLAIVKRIIDRHGGTVRVESVPGEGSTFFFTLPAA